MAVKDNVFKKPWQDRLPKFNVLRKAWKARLLKLTC